MSGDTNARAWRMRLAAVLMLLFVFVAGGLVGAAVERGGHDDRSHGEVRRPDRRGPPPLFAEGSPLAERLKLTDAQRDTIETITTRDRTAADSLFREARHVMRERFDSTLAAVNSVLTPEQRAEWQKVRGEWQERMERERREGRGRHGRRRDGSPGFPGGPPPPGDSGAGPGPPPP